MYKCIICETLYDLSKEHYSFIREQIKTKPVIAIETIIKCPECKKRIIIGGEDYYDQIDERDIIMIFSKDLYNSENEQNLKEFVGERIEDKKWINHLT